MSQYLINTVETYRVDSEAEAVAAIDAAKKDKNFILSKYTTEYKEVKAKGEVIDTYYKVTLTKKFTDIKEPDCQASVEYHLEDVFDFGTRGGKDNDDNE